MKPNHIKALTPEQRIEAIKHMTEDLVRTCGNAGFIITIEQRPLQPLAMGHTESVVSVREKLKR